MSDTGDARDMMDARDARDARDKTDATDKRERYLVSYQPSAMSPNPWRSSRVRAALQRLFNGRRLLHSQWILEPREPTDVQQIFAVLEKYIDKERDALVICRADPEGLATCGTFLDAERTP